MSYSRNLSERPIRRGQVDPVHVVNDVSIVAGDDPLNTNVVNTPDVNVANPVEIDDSTPVDVNLVSPDPINVNMQTAPSTPTYIAAGDSPSIGAFSRWRVSNPVTTFDSQHEYDLSPVFWQSQITNNSGSASATHVANESTVALTVGANDDVIFQSKNYHRYQPGKSQLIIKTFNFGATDSAVIKRTGYFDDDDGIFLQNDGGTLGVVLRTSTSGAPVDTVVTQPNWNLDPMDGTGPSGVTLDAEFAQILVIDLQWLGVGRVRIGVDIDGLIYYVHQFLNANVKDTIYMRTANLPLRYQITAGAGLVGTDVFNCICSQVSSEGGFQVERNVTFGIGHTSFRSINARTPLLSIRPRLTFNGIVNRTQLLEELFTVLTQDESVYYELVYGGAITGGAWNNVDTTYSVVEANLTATGITGGFVADAGHAFGSTALFGNVRASTARSSIRPRLPLALNIAGAHPTTGLRDTLTVVATSMGGATDIAASINWRELR